MTDRIYEIVDHHLARQIHEAFTEIDSLAGMTVAEAVASAADGGCACDPEDIEDSPYGCLRCEALIAYGFTWDRVNGVIVWTPPA